MQELQGYTQNVLRHGVVEFAFGEPDPALLPVGLIREAAAGALDRYGPGAISYGRTEGPSALRERLACRFAAREGRDVAASEILVSGGNSQALDQALTVFTEPGDVVLVESPTYSLALRIIGDYPVQVLGVPIDDDGLDVAALEDVLLRLRGQGKRARLLYTIPTFHNPASMSLEPGRRRRLLEVAREHELILVEDDVYRELAYDGQAPPSLWALDSAAPVVRLRILLQVTQPGPARGMDRCARRSP